MDIKQINFSGTELEDINVSDITVSQIRDFFEKSDSRIVKEFLNKNKLMDADKKRDGYGYKYAYDTIFYFCFEDEKEYMEKYFEKRFYSEGSNRREDVGVTSDLISSLGNLFKDKRKGVEENNSKVNAEEYKKSRGINEKTTLREIYYILLNTPDKYRNEDSFENRMEMISSMIGINDSNSNIQVKKHYVDDTTQKLKELIDNKQYQIILTGAPGTGKTYMAKKIAKEYVENELDETQKGELSKFFEERIKMVQFHPSYDYTDFVEGLRPIDNNGEMVFCKIDGTFKAFCRKVAENNKKELDEESISEADNEQVAEKKLPLYFFLIDEINRADLSKVFGELMFCLEKDKRGEPIQTQYQNLPSYYENGEKIEDDIFENKGGFFVPENIVIIGTMNDIDRSVESMDFALRRRFVWQEVAVTEALLLDAFKSEKFFGEILDDNDIECFAKHIVNFNEKMHKQVSYLNSGYDISQGQFADMPEECRYSIDTVLEWTWKYRVESLLKEYMRGDQKCEEYMEILKNIWFRNEKQTNDEKADDIKSGEQEKSGEKL